MLCQEICKETAEICMFSLQMSHWEKKHLLEETACQYFQHNQKQINVLSHLGSQCLWE